MTRSDQRTEPVFVIDLRDLAEEDARPIPEIGSMTASNDPADLEHPEPSARLAAVTRLAERSEFVPIAAVGARLRDPQPSVRRAAIQVLDATGDDRALVHLLDALQDPVEEVRGAAGDALRRHRSPELLSLIRAELQVPARAEAADAALAMLSEKERSEPPADPPPDDLGLLLELLGDPRPDRRRIACERLGYRRVRSAVDPLIERLADPERGVRIKAADALAQIGDERATDALERAGAVDPDPGVVQAMERAARTLALG